MGRVEERPLSTGVRKGELRDSRAPGWRLSKIDDRHDFAFPPRRACLAGAISLLSSQAAICSMIPSQVFKVC